jgi:hypothetical protein
MFCGSYGLGIFSDGWYFAKEIASSCFKYHVITLTAQDVVAEKSQSVKKNRVISDLMSLCELKYIPL